jgi:hypothetical protein
MQPDNVSGVVVRTRSVDMTACVVAAARLLGACWEGDAPLAFNMDCIKGYEPTEVETARWPTAEEVMDRYTSFCEHCHIPTAFSFSAQGAWVIIQNLLSGAFSSQAPTPAPAEQLALEDEAEGLNEDDVEPMPTGVADKG